MDSLKTILTRVDEEEIISLTQELIQVDTVNPPGNEAGAAAIIARKLEQAGIDVKTQKLADNRANIIGIIKGSGEKPALLFNGHLDTVPPGKESWEYSPFSGQIADGRIYGRGASDMKSGLAALVLAACILKKSGIELKGDLIVAGTAGEEVDSLGARAFVEAGYLDNVGNIVIAEPSNLKLFTCQKGALWLEFTAIGRTAHGSMPDLGENAILIMNKFLNSLTKYEFDYSPHSLLTAPTINVGTINGGVKTNVVPDQCVLTLDLRTIPGQSHDLIINDLTAMFEQCLSNKDKGKIRILNNREPIEIDPYHPLVITAQKVGREVLSLVLEPAGVNYYTDASVLVKEKNVPVILFGPGDEKLAHQPNEYVEIDKLTAAVKYYIALALELLT